MKSHIKRIECLLFLVVFGWVSFPSLGWAVKPDIKAAKAAYSEGYELYEKRKIYKAALRKFLRAIKHLPPEKKYTKTRAVLFFYVGACYAKTGNLQQAKKYLLRYQRANAEKTKKKEARSLLRTVEARLKKAEARRLKARRRPKVRSPKSPRIPLTHPKSPKPPVKPTARKPTPRKPDTGRTPPKGDSKSKPRKAGGKLVSPNTPKKPRKRKRQIVVVVDKSKKPVVKRPKPEPKPKKPAIIPFIVMGGGAAIAAAGAIVGGLALSNDGKANDLFKKNLNPQESDTFAKEVTDLKNAAKLQTTASYALVGGGAVILATGVVLFVLGRQKKPQKKPSPSGTVAPKTRGATSFSFSF